MFALDFLSSGYWLVLSELSRASHLALPLCHCLTRRAEPFFPLLHTPQLPLHLHTCNNLNKLYSYVPVQPRHFIYVPLTGQCIPLSEQ